MRIENIEFWRNFGRASVLAKAGDFAACQGVLRLLEDLLDASDSQFRDSRRELLSKFREVFPLAAGQSARPRGGRDASFSVDRLVEAGQPGISLVTCCMNRNDNLIQALPSWLKLKEIDEVVIVDWTSKNPVFEYLREHGVADPRISIVRVEKQERWILSYAFNLGFRVAKYDKILKTDSDIVLRTDFFEKNLLCENAFLSGDWRVAEKGQEHINGFFYVRRADLLAVKGFNEHITTYGWDDDDIYSRLQASGLRRDHIEANSVYHIPHHDSERLGGTYQEPLCGRDELRASTLHKIRRNRYISFVMPEWNADRLFVPFDVKHVALGYVEVEQSELSFHDVPAHVREDADYYASLELVSWRCGPQACRLNRELLNSLLSARRLDDITRLDVALLLTGEFSGVEWKRNALVIRWLTGNGQPTVLIFQLLDELSRQLNCTIFLAGIEDSDQTSKLMVDYPGVMRMPSGTAVEGMTHLPFQTVQQVRQAFMSQPIYWTDLDPSTLSLSLFSETTATGGAADGSVSAMVGESCVRRRLYIDAQHGLGNRLRAFASARAIAEKTGREVVLVWVPDHHCECRFDDLYEYDGVVIDRPTEIDLRRVDMYNYMESEAGSKKDEPILLDTSNDIYVRSAFVLNNPLTDWDSENRVLRGLRPCERVRNLIAPFENSKRVGVHVRMEGAVGLDRNAYDSCTNWSEESHRKIQYWRSTSHYGKFMDRINSLISEEPNLELYLAADTKAVYEIFRDSYGDRLSMLERTIYNRSCEQLVYALADAVLLSKCRKLLGSTWSSFSELAMRLSTSYSTIEMSGKDF